MTVPTLLLFSAALIPPLHPDLQRKYDAYIAATEARIEREVRAEPFLWAERSPERWRRVRAGRVVVEPFEGHAGTSFGNGLLHDWIGALFVSGATLERAVAFLQDYGHHKNYYQPEVVDSRLVGREGENFLLRYRIVKRYVLTVVVNTDQTAAYERLGPTRLLSSSVSTRIAEVEHAGKPNEHELDPHKGPGIVWRLNTYWRLEEKDGGVYIECEAITLTRAAPAGLGWLVHPIVRSFPGASLAHLLEATRMGIRGRR